MPQILPAVAKKRRDTSIGTLQGPFVERMMGLEPTTFCMATGPWIRP